jgi:alcohol dehydrogenase
MKALVYHGPNKKKWEEKPKPVLLEPTDAVVRIVKTTICGTDLHILKGDVPEVTDGRILGHEGVGIIEEVGAAVTGFAPGDHVLISCITSCGKCEYCRKGMYSHCEKGGWILGHLIDGTQAEYVRIPFADNSLYHIPVDAEEEALVMLSDILPTAFECGVINGQVKPGDTVAIIGAGPIGLAVLITAQFYTPARIIMVDVDDNRLNVAKTFGATHVINSSSINAAEQIMQITEQKGVDVAIEAVGIPETFELCESIIAPGGHIANVGVHGKSVSLHLETLWSKNITITTRLVDTVTTPMLLKTVVSKKVQPAKLITHHFALHDIIQAYETFGNAAREKTLKVILTNEMGSGKL